MSKSGGFTITFKAVDGATTTIQSINKQLASLTKPIQAFDRAGKGFGGVAGLNSLTGGMKQFAGETFNAFRSMDRLIPSLGLITSAGTIGGMVALAKAWGETGLQIGQASRKIGIAASTLNTLQAAGRLAGVSTEAMTEALSGLATHMRDALGGRDTNANVMMMTLFGKDGPEKMKEDLTKLLPEIMDKIKAIRNPQDQQRAADALGLGGILTIMQQGGAAFEAYIKQAKELSGQTEKDIKDQEAFAKSLLGVQEAARGVWLEMGKRATYLTPYLDQLTAWIAGHKTLATDIATLAAAMAAVKPAKWLLKALGITAGIGAFTGSIGAILATPGDTSNTPEAHLAHDPVSNPNFFDPYGRGGTWLWGPPRRPGVGPRAGAAPGVPGIPYQAGSLLGGVGATQSQYDTFRHTLGGIEQFKGDPSDPMGYRHMGGSSNRFAGRYQMGEKEIAETARRLFEKVPSRDQFLNDPAMQERFFEAYTQGHHQYLMENSPEYQKMSPSERLAALGYAHNQGAAGAASWLRTGQVGRDAFNTPGTRYSEDIARALAAGNRSTAPAGMPGVGPSFGPQGGSDQRGHVQVDVHIKGPAGTSAQSSSKGPVISPPPKVSETMPTGGTG